MQMKVIDPLVLEAAVCSILLSLVPPQGLGHGDRGWQGMTGGDREPPTVWGLWERIRKSSAA